METPEPLKVLIVYDLKDNVLGVADNEVDAEKIYMKKYPKGRYSIYRREEVKLNEIKLSLQSYLEYKQQTPKPVFQLRQEKLGR